jgi:hypothetical protein
MLFLGFYSPAVMEFGGNYRPGRLIVKSAPGIVSSQAGLLAGMAQAGCRAV